ncbi:MAG: hypothetical protein QW775_01380 [Ignisphaera sp.]|uniref:Uncharacterized protein n=1 Tax=Ignisphaera aggregans TaxID=334771 RepID=A0A7C4NNB4_9CREN
MSSITKKVIEYLKWHPNAKPADIANYLGVNIKIIRAILIRLRQKGIVVKSEKGYSLRPGINIELELENGSQESMVTRVYEIRESHDESKDITESVNKSLSKSVTVEDGVSSSDRTRLIVYELSDRISAIEKRILEIENTLNNLVLKIEDILKNRKYRFEEVVDKINVELYIEAIEVIKMCFQAILTNDTSMLNSLIDELEYITDNIKQKVKSEH